MSAFETAKTVLTVLIIIASISLRFGSVPDFWWIIKHKTTGEVQLLPIMSMGTNCALVVLYAEAIHDYLPLMATSVFGVFMAIVYSVMYHHYTPNRPAVYRLWAVCCGLVLALTIYAALALTGVTHQSRSQVSSILGWITIFSTCFLYISPLATVTHVIKTKNAASIPFGFCLLCTVNAGLWLVYSALVSEWLIFVPNVLGFPLGVLQVSLWLIYRPESLGGSKSLAVLPAAPAPRESTVSVEIVPTPRNGIERIPCAAKTSGTFVELATPRH